MDREPTLSELVKALRDDTTALVREEVALAKTEISENVSRIALNAGYIAAGALVAFVALIMFLMGLAKLLALFLVSLDISPNLAEFLGYLGVATAVGFIAAAVIAKALQTLKKQPLAPEKTIETLKEDKEWAKQKIQ